jgi:hypothetical protein
MKVAIATGFMDLVSGASQLAITLSDGLKDLGHEPFIVTRKNGYYGLRYAQGRVRVYTPFEFAQVPPDTDVGIVCHPRSFPEMVKLPKSVWYIMGWAHTDMPLEDCPVNVACSEELKVYLDFLGVDDVKVVTGCIDLKRIKVGPKLRKKPKVLIATTKSIPRMEWYERCEKLGWEPYIPDGPYPIPNLHDHYPNVDIVIGTETVAIEALAAGRASFVAGPWGFDGWITPDNVHNLIKHATSGRFHGHDLDLMEDALEMYEPSMGDYGRELAEEVFNPVDKAKQLLELAA